MWPMFKIKMLIDQSMANLDGKILFDKIAHHLDEEIRKILARGVFDSLFHSGK